MTGKRDKPGAHTRPGDEFTELVGAVRPLKPGRRVILRKAGPPPRARFSRADERAVLRESVAGSADGPGLESGEELSYRRPHVPPRVIKELRRGRYAVQDELDLHGMTANGARAALRAFMTDVLLHGHRCVRIIHGKGLRSGPGGPVLKAKLNHWLPQWSEVLAFVTAPARDGGSGAVYVLLAR